MPVLQAGFIIVDCAVLIIQQQQHDMSIRVMKPCPLICTVRLFGCVLTLSIYNLLNL
jgi:hypothetical protein